MPTRRREPQPSGHPLFFRGSFYGKRRPFLGSLLLAAAWAIVQCPAPDAFATDSETSSDTCLGCHEEQADEFGRTRMGQLMMSHPRTEQERQGCLGCHGNGAAHVEAGGLSKQGLITFTKEGESKAVQDAPCVKCHQGGGQAFWGGSMHDAAGLSCTSCHIVMRRSSAQLKAADSRTELGRRRARTETCLRCHPRQRAQLMRSSHMPLREGKLVCTSCHNPHGTLNPALLEESTVNDNCYRCHAEKRGPFLWEHAPVVEDCLSCHQTHGSLHGNLLKAKAPLLCQRCHASPGHSSAALPASSRFAFNRSCLNCHSQVHGSNHPSGVNLLR